MVTEQSIAENYEVKHGINIIAKDITSQCEAVDTLHFRD